MFGKLFDTTAVDTYAAWLLDEMKRTLPPGFDPNLKNVAEKADTLNRRISKETESLTKNTRLNIYKKAHLASKVREGMTAHGYPEAFVKAFSMDLLKRIQVFSKQRA